MEDLLYEYGVDIVFNGHVSALFSPREISSIIIIVISMDETNIAELRTLCERIFVVLPIIVRNPM